MRFEWNSEKNKHLKEHRGISFEDVVVHLSQGNLWKIGEHPDQSKYPNQFLYFVIVNDYIYIVPYKTNQEVIILITIIPSRKATRAYQKEKELL